MKLYLIPNTVSFEGAANTIASCVYAAIKDVRTFYVEEPKSARGLLKKLDAGFPVRECNLIPLNEHTSESQVKELLLKAGTQDIGLISEAGYPCVADPGADLVRLAHSQSIEVVPLPGASSIILALAASGLNGQNFAFNGYLPKDKDERLKKIRALEQKSSNERQTQIVMETPYRNQNLMEELIETCHTNTLLCVASDITGPAQMIKTATIAQWKKRPPALHKNPTLFLLLYNS